MKKFILPILFLVLVGCSNDNNDIPVNNNTSSAVLVKKVVTGYNGRSDLVVDLMYDGNKLIRTNANTLPGMSGIMSIHLYTLYTYTGDLITKESKYYISNNALYEEVSFQYDNSDKLISQITIYSPSAYAEKTLYIYNTDGTVTYETHSGNATSQTNLSGTGKFWFDNDGEITRVEDYQNGALLKRKDMTYDVKNGAYKNITGYDKLLSSYGENGPFNVTTSSSYDANLVFTYGESLQFVYDANDYPVSSVTTQNLPGNPTAPFITQYFY
ncbi:MAG: hypothetical protein ABI426_07305 [Flavobacterium sp.]